MDQKIKNIISALESKFAAHPWHGISVGEKSPEIVNAFIEIIPSDTIKYEIDKPSGHIMVDRPQKYSNNMPCLYGFIPQTYCDTLIGNYSIRYLCAF
jgi:inorganic pyrophosphatase